MRVQATCARATTKPCSSSAARLRPFLLAADLAFFRFECRATWLGFRVRARVRVRVRVHFEWRATWSGFGLGSVFGFGFGFGFA